MKMAKKDVSIVGNTISQFMKAQMENIDYLSNEIIAGNIVNGEDAKTRKVLDNIQNAKENVVEQTYVGNENGEFMNSPRFTHPSGYDPRERPWYQQAMDQPVLSVKRMCLYLKSTDTFMLQLFLSHIYATLIIVMFL